MAASDALSNNIYGLIGAIMPAVRGRAVTPSDTVDIDPAPSRGLQVLADGTVTLLFADDTTEVAVTMLAGVVYPYAVKRVFSTGTDAGVVSAGVVALY